MNQVSVYVLDISVLLCTPGALFEFPDKEIVIPVTILEELDSLKLDLGEKGRSAQIVSQMLDECRQYGSLVEGISLPNGGKLRIELTEPESGLLPYSLNLKRISNRVLAVAWMLSQKNKILSLFHRTKIYEQKLTHSMFQHFHTMGKDRMTQTCMLEFVKVRSANKN